MTRKSFLLMLMASAFAFWGCTSDNDYMPEKRQSITISTNIDDGFSSQPDKVSTRTGHDAIGRMIFVENDEVAVYAWTGSKDYAPPASERVVDNVVNTLNADGKWIPASQMLWKNPVEKHYFVGIYPAPAEPVADLSNQPYTIVPKDNVANDILVAVTDDGAVSSNKPVNLTFDHIMARFIVNLSFCDQWGEHGPTVEKVMLGNVATDASINYVKQTVSPVPGAAHSDVEMPCNTSNWQFSYVGVPQSGINTVKVTIEGKEYVYTHPVDFTFVGGKSSMLNLTVGRNKITFGGMSIENWRLGDYVSGNTSGYNPAQYITDKDKLTMIYNLVDLEKDGGRIYEMDYTADYKLNDALDTRITDINGLQQFVAKNLFDVAPSKAPYMGFGAGCSAFAVNEKGTSNYLMGRNYDFCHKDADGNEKEISAIVVKTHPWGGKKTVSVVDGYWLGMNKGFMTDGLTDLSMLMAAPYAFMDGINEDGFAIGVLHLDGKPTKQTDASKKNIYMNVAMRMLLDWASDVDDAVTLLNRYNMHMASPAGGSFHFYMADAKGKYAIVEYVSETGNINENPWKIHVMKDNDKYRYLTNFYVSDYMKDTPYGVKSDHGKDRYETLEREIHKANFSLDMSGVTYLLDRVSQAPDTKVPTSHTQWSSVYNLSQKTLRLYLLRKYYNTKPFDFDLK